MSFKKEWQKFLCIAFNPWVVLFSISSIILIYQSTNTSDKLTLALLNVMLITTSAVLGAICTKIWTRMSDEGALHARGKSAVRGLKLLLQNIQLLDNRVNVYLNRTKERAAEDTIFITYLEEVHEKCVVLAEETVSSIENWTDIVPEADVKTHIGIISDMKKELLNAQEDLSGMKESLEKAEGTSTREREKLMKEIKDQKRKIRELEEEVTTKQIEFGTPLYSNPTAINLTYPFNLPEFEGTKALAEAAKATEGLSTGLLGLGNFYKNKDNDDE